MSGGPVDVSVLVTTYRRPRHLALALESLALQPEIIDALVTEHQAELLAAESGTQ